MVLHGYVFSQILEIDTGITVVIPNRFKRNSRYQVAYLLHGLYGNNDSWVDNTMLPVYANDYHTIFILPEVGRTFYTDMQFGAKYFSYITEELPIICQSIFNISSTPDDTVIIGGSMGGYGALKCALNKPDQYGFCCALSSACLFLKENLAAQRANKGKSEFKGLYGERLLNDFEAIFGEELEWKPEYEIMELVKEVNSELIKPQLYIACGTEDGLLADNKRFCSEMEELGFPFTYEEWEGNHDWYFFNDALRKSLIFCFGRK